MASACSLGTDRGLTEGVSDTIHRLQELLTELADLPRIEAVARGALGWHAFRSGDLDAAWSHQQEALRECDVICDVPDVWLM